MARNKLVVNNLSIEVEDGSVVELRNGVIYVDDQPIQSQLAGEVHLHWHGDLVSLRADGSVTCRDVDGDVTAGGSVQCRDVEGSVSAGSVQARGIAKVVEPTAIGFSGNINVTSGGGAGGAVRIGHGAIEVGNVGDSCSRRPKKVQIGGSVYLD